MSILVLMVNFGTQSIGTLSTGVSHLQTKPHNLVETKVIRDLNPSDINKLISVSGMITRTSNVIPDLR